VARPSRKDQILDAALACFAELGYDATRIRHIADRAGVSESALYRHYPSKDAVAQELYQQYFDLYAQRLRAIADAPGGAEERLRAVVRTTLALYRAHPAAFTFALLRLPSFLPALPAGTTYPMDVLTGIVHSGQRAGAVRNGQPNLLAAIFLGCMLRPIIVATFAAPGALNLLGDDRHDAVIEEAALAALRRPAGRTRMRATK